MSDGVQSDRVQGDRVIDFQRARRRRAATRAAARGGPDIAADLRRAILEGAFRHREQLPPERSLSADYGVSRQTVRDALDRLAAEQLVVRRVGSGTFVALPLHAEASQLADLASPLDLIEARLTIEPGLARLAAINARAPDLARLDQLLARLEDWGGDAARFAQTQGLYLQALAEASHNPMMVSIYRVITQVRHDAERQRQEHETLEPARIADYNRQQRQLLTLIRRRDAEGATRLMAGQLAATRRDLLGPGGL